MEWIYIPIGIFSVLALIELLCEVNWSCLVGLHMWVYFGEKHGMVMTKDKMLQGTARKIYGCAHCKAIKPYEKKDNC